MSRPCPERAATPEDRAFASLRDAVQCNCHISDARHAGDYSLCIYLLKMREFYRWEQRLALTAQLPRDEIGSWLSTRESLWDELAEASYAPLPVYRRRLDPFDVDAINARLRPHGLVYGGGLGLGGKPLFFLGTLQRREVREGLEVLIVADEHARDLAAPPAMYRDGTVTVRRESLRRVTWERIEAWQWRRREGGLGDLLGDYGFDDDPDGALERMTDDQVESLVLHELGEARAGELLGPEWEAMLTGLGRSRAEVFARAVRDHLADCRVTLPALLERDDGRALRFYLAGLDGPRRALFPALAGCPADDAAALARAAARGAEHWLALGRELLGLWREGGDGAGAAITARAEGAALH